MWVPWHFWTWTSETEQRDVAAIVDGTEDADDAAVVKGELTGSEITDSEADRDSDCGPGCDTGMASRTAPLLAITNGDVGTAGQEFTQTEKGADSEAGVGLGLMSSNILATKEEDGRDGETAGAEQGMKEMDGVAESAASLVIEQRE